MQTTGSSNFKSGMKTLALMALLAGLLIGTGYLIGGMIGATFALAISFAINFFTYFKSDRIAIRSAGAVPMSENDYPEIYQITRGLCQKADLPMPGLFLIPTSQPNAFASGRNKNHAVVAITDGLMKSLSTDELTGVIAHELAHIKNNDILIQSVVIAFASAISWIAFWIGDFSDSLFGFVGALIAMLLAPVAAMLVQSAISQQREFAADAGGAQFCGNPESLAAALMRIEQAAAADPLEVNPATESMYIISPLRAGEKFSRLFSSHPPTEERVKRLRQMRPSF